jgi:hypothetical protein
MYGFTTYVSGPKETYQVVHRAVMDVVTERGSGGEGLVLHVAYTTDEGFAVVEVWESREQSDAFYDTIMPLAMERAGVPADAPEPRIEEFETIGVLVPAAAGAAAEEPTAGG